MTKLNPTLPLIATFAIILNLSANYVAADRCNSNSYVYGANEIIDQLLICSVSKMYDLSLIHQGEFIKNTPKTFVENGFANKTTILYAKLNGIWTTRRVRFIESGWRCDANKTIVNAVIRIDGLSMDMIERVDVPLHRSQYKLAQHKPCKTFDLPLWLCRSSKQLFKTTRTWVNSAYFNVTLTQSNDQQKPILEKLSLMFTCPETFKQKIIFSPSATYVMSKYLSDDSETLIEKAKPKLEKRDETSVSSESTSASSSASETSPASPAPATSSSSSAAATAAAVASELSASTATVAAAAAATSTATAASPSPSPSTSEATTTTATAVVEKIENVSENVVSHPVSFVSAQDGRGPATPPYHSIVNLITIKAGETLQKALENCIQILDSDLSVVSDQTSFSQSKFVDQSTDRYLVNVDTSKIDCSTRLWVKNKIGLMENFTNLAEEQNQINEGHEKRSQYMLRYPVDPNQLLNPYGYYHENADQMID